MAKRKYICYSDDTTPSAGGVNASGGTGNVYPSYTGGSGSGTQINDDKAMFSAHGTFVQTLRAIYAGNGATQPSYGAYSS